jgi:integrase
VVWDGVKPIVRGPKSSAGIRSLFLPEAAGGILLEYLTEVPSGEEALLFSRECDGRTHLGEYDLNPSWRKSRSIAEFRGRFHSLRAFAATEFAKANPTAAELMERFGHKDIKTAMRYQRTTDRELELLKRMVGV